MSTLDHEAPWDYDAVRAQYAKMRANGTRLVGLEPFVDELLAKLAAAEAERDRANQEAVYAHRAWLRVSDQLDDAVDALERIAEGHPRHSDPYYPVEIAKHALATYRAKETEE